MSRGWWIAIAAVAVLLGIAWMGRRTIAAGALSLLERFEGRENRAYLDVAGLWTIGVGHKVLPQEMAHYVGDVLTINGKKRGSVVISEAEIDRLAAEDTAVARAAVERLVKVPVSENQRSALTSFVYNLGVGAFTGSTLLRLLNARDYRGAAAEFVRWNKARVNGVLEAVPGLTARRTAEKVLFEADIA